MFLLRLVVLFAIWQFVWLALGCTPSPVQIVENKPIESNVAPIQTPTDLNPQGWALGCAAVLFERNHVGHDTLAGRTRNKRNIEEKKASLKDSWGIENRQDLLDSLSWIENGGHRNLFLKTGFLIDFMDDKVYRNFLELNKQNPTIINRAKIVRVHYNSLGQKNLMGWDYSRYICLCRWGYLMGLLSEEEAWERIMPVARKLQKTFDSWANLGENYLIGRQFWSYRRTLENGYLIDDAYQRLLEMPSSPWNRYPWDMDLDQQTVSGPSHPARKAAETAASP